MSKLAEFPKLQVWYKGIKSEPDATHPIDCMVWMTCRLLAKEVTVETLQIWISHSNALVSLLEHPDNFIEATEHRFLENQLDFHQLIAELGELSFCWNLGREFSAFATLIAKTSGLDEYYFLSAWSAFNLNEFKNCIEICQRIRQPVAATYSLLGQSYIELSLFKSALESLQIACEIDPDDPLSWFQLAKTKVNLLDYQGAWDAITNCQYLIPGDPEVAIFMGALALHVRGDIADKAYENLAKQLLANRNSAKIILILLKLCMKIRNQAEFLKILSVGDWLFLRRDLTLFDELSSIASQLNQLGWKQAQNLLSQLLAGEHGLN